MEKILSKDELSFLEGLFNPISFFNYFMPYIDSNVEISRIYQDNILLSGQLDKPMTMVVRTGRGTGKTTSLNADVGYTALLNPLKEGVITTPNKAHIDPIFNKLIAFFQSNPLFKLLTDTSKGARIVRSPEYYIEFINGFRLYGRIAGASKGTSLFGLHCDFVWVDEGGVYLKEAVDNLQGALNKNCVVKVFGVPCGLKNSYLSILWDDKSIPSFLKFKISRFEDPNFTEKEQKRLEKIYGGRNTASWRNQVEAEDDIIQKVTFNHQYYDRCFQEYDDYNVAEFDGTKFNENDLIEENDILLPSVPKGMQIGIGEDVGYDPDPSVISIFSIDKDGIIKLIHKIILRSITFTKQSKILHYLAKQLNALYIAIDTGGAGRTIYLDLINEALFPDRDYLVYEVEFGGSILIGKDEKGKDIKSLGKFYSTVLLDRRFQAKSIIFPTSDSEMYNEVYSSTQYKTNDGHYKYNGIDHNLDSVRAMLLGKLFYDSEGMSDAPDDNNPNTKNNNSDIMKMVDF